MPAQRNARSTARSGASSRCEALGTSTTFGDLWRRAATYVDRILKGAKPADLLVEQPTKFELFINKKTANALGLKIPQSIMDRGGEII